MNDIAQTDFASSPEAAEAAAIAARVAERVAGTAIANPEQYSAAGTLLKEVKAEQKRVETLLDGITRPLNGALKAARDLFRPRLEAIAGAEARLKRAMIDYQTEQERIRREEQRRAEEAAEKERQRLAKLQAKAEQRGDASRAEVYEERAAAVVAPVIQREPPKVAGLATREVWKFEVVDLAAVPREYLMADEPKLRRVVAALKGDAKVPGVRVYAERSIAAGAA